jgi:hypothetical protein
MARAAFAPLPSLTAARSALSTPLSGGALAGAFGVSAGSLSAARATGSIHAALADDAKHAAEAAAGAARSAKFEARDAMERMEEVKASAWRCDQCRRHYPVRERLCVERGHTLHQEETVQRFYRCNGCQVGALTFLGPAVPFGIRCPKCGIRGTWRRTSAGGLPICGVAEV